MKNQIMKSLISTAILMCSMVGTLGRAGQEGGGAERSGGMGNGGIAVKFRGKFHLQDLFEAGVGLTTPIAVRPLPERLSADMEAELQKYMGVLPKHPKTIRIFYAKLLEIRDVDPALATLIGDLMLSYRWSITPPELLHTNDIGFTPFKAEGSGKNRIEYYQLAFRDDVQRAVTIFQEGWEKLADDTRAATLYHEVGSIIQAGSIPSAKQEKENRLNRLMDLLPSDEVSNEQRRLDTLNLYVSSSYPTRNFVGFLFSRTFGSADEKVFEQRTNILCFAGDCGIRSQEQEEETPAQVTNPPAAEGDSCIRYYGNAFIHKSDTRSPVIPQYEEVYKLQDLTTEQREFGRTVCGYETHIRACMETNLRKRNGYDSDWDLQMVVERANSCRSGDIADSWLGTIDLSPDWEESVTTKTTPVTLSACAVDVVARFKKVQKSKNAWRKLKEPTSKQLDRINTLCDKLGQPEFGDIRLDCVLDWAAELKVAGSNYFAGVNNIKVGPDLFISRLKAGLNKCAK